MIFIQTNWLNISVGLHEINIKLISLIWVIPNTFGVALWLYVRELLPQKPRLWDELQTQNINRLHLACGSFCFAIIKATKSIKTLLPSPDIEKLEDMFTVSLVYEYIRHTKSYLHISQLTKLHRFYWIILSAAFLSQPVYNMPKKIQNYIIINQPEPTVCREVKITSVYSYKWVYMHNTSKIIPL